MKTFVRIDTPDAPRVTLDKNSQKLEDAERRNRYMDALTNGRMDHICETCAVECKKCGALLHEEGQDHDCKYEHGE